MNQDKKDILRWLELSEDNYTPDELKEEFEGIADLERAIKLAKSALSSKTRAKVVLNKISDKEVEYKIEQE